MLCPPRKLILWHSYSRQMAKPLFEPWSFRYASKYCNYTGRLLIGTKPLQVTILLNFATLRFTFPEPTSWCC